MQTSLKTLSSMLDPDDEINSNLKDKKENLNDINTNKENADSPKQKDKKNEIINDKKDKNKEKTKIKEERKESIKNENISNIEQNKSKEDSNDNINKLKNKIKKLNDIKIIGNEFYLKKLYDEAISKYSEGYKIINEELLEVNRNRMLAYNPEIQNFISLSKHIMSYLSSSYIKQEKYKESIEIDKKIISLDPKYDKSYARLFKSYKKLNKRAEAVFFGDILIKNFSNEVREKYKDLIPLIINEKNELEKIEKQLKEREARKKFLRLIIPIIIIVISAFYSRFSKKSKKF